jgi:GNAT superfamily N-acetyltransferase
MGTEFGPVHGAIDLKTESAEIIKSLPVRLVTDAYGAMEVTELERLAFKGDGEDVFTIATLGKIGWLWGAYDDGILVGAVEVFRQRDSNKGFIHGVIVHPDAQYKGLGTRLISYSEDEALKAGIDQIECTIAATNGASLRAFLNNSGYHASKYLPDCYGEGGHRLWVAKNLKEPTEPFNHHSMLKRHLLGEKVFFVADDDCSSIEKHFQDEEMAVVGVVKPAESGFGKNLLCFAKLSTGK